MVHCATLMHKRPHPSTTTAEALTRLQPAAASLLNLVDEVDDAVAGLQVGAHGGGGALAAPEQQRPAPRRRCRQRLAVHGVHCGAGPAIHLLNQNKRMQVAPNIINDVEFLVESRLTQAPVHLSPPPDELHGSRTLPSRRLSAERGMPCRVQR